MLRFDQTRRVSAPSRGPAPLRIGSRGWGAPARASGSPVMQFSDDDKSEASGDDSDEEEERDVAGARVLGHEAGPHATPRQIARIERHIANLKFASRVHKSRVMTQLYRSRLQPNSEAAGSPFKQQLGRLGADLAQGHVTHQKVRDRLTRGGFTFQEDPETYQTHVYHQGKHVYTLHGGMSAYKPVGVSSTGRTVFHSKGFDKEYVADDFGVPTRRFAYAVKSAKQLGSLYSKAPGKRRQPWKSVKLARSRWPKGVIKGRYSVHHPRQSILEPTVGEKALLGHETPGSKAAGQELPRAPRRLPVGNMLFFHQMYGSDNRQRGVSATTTRKPLLSNAGFGFADKPGARKAVIDTATLPLASKKSGPMFVNLHHHVADMPRRGVAPGQRKVKDPRDPAKVRAQQGLQFSSAVGQANYERSIAKNRELFIRQVRRRNIVQTLDPLREEQLVAGGVNSAAAPPHTGANILRRFKSEAKKTAVLERERRLFPSGAAPIQPLPAGLNPRQAAAAVEQARRQGSAPRGSPGRERQYADLFARLRAKLAARK